MRFSNINFEGNKIYIRRSIAPLLADMVTTAWWIAGLSITFALGFTSWAQGRLPDLGSLRSHVWLIFGISLIVWAPGLFRATLDYAKSLSYVIDFDKGQVYSPKQQYGSIEDVSDVSLESSVPSGFKVQYRVILRLASGRILPIAITPSAPTVLDAILQGNPFGRLRGVIRLKWTASLDWEDSNSKVVQEMRELELKIWKALDEYKLRVNSVSE